MAVQNRFRIFYRPTRNMNTVSECGKEIRKYVDGERTSLLYSQNTDERIKYVCILFQKKYVREKILCTANII